MRKFSKQFLNSFVKMYVSGKFIPNLLFVLRFGGYSKLADLLSLTTIGFSSQQQIAQLESFYNTKLTEFGSSANVLRNAIDDVKLDLRWAEVNLPDAIEHMHQVAGSASIVCASYALMLVAILMMFW